MKTAASSDYLPVSLHIKKARLRQRPNPCTISRSSSRPLPSPARGVLKSLTIFLSALLYLPHSISQPMKSRRLATRSAKSSSMILGCRVDSSREKIRWKPWIIEIREQNESVPTNEEELRRTLESGRSEDWKNIQIALCALEEHEKSGTEKWGHLCCWWPVPFRGGYILIFYSIPGVFG